MCGSWTSNSCEYGANCQNSPVGECDVTKMKLCSEHMTVHRESTDHPQRLFA